MTPTPIKTFACGIIAGATITVLVAAPARADNGDVDRVVLAYANTFAPAVCSTIDDHGPTADTFLGMGSAIMDDGLTATQAGQVIYLAVSDSCNEYMPALMAWAESGRPAFA